MISNDAGLVMKVCRARATGVLLFTRIKPRGVVVIPLGTRAVSEYGIVFMVIGHLNHTGPGAIWQISDGNNGVLTHACAEHGGNIGNASPGTITRLLSPLAGIDAVTNPDEFTGGASWGEWVTPP